MNLKWKEKIARWEELELRIEQLAAAAAKMQRRLARGTAHAISPTLIISFSLVADPIRTTTTRGWTSERTTRDVDCLLDPRHPHLRR